MTSKRLIREWQNELKQYGHKNVWKLKSEIKKEAMTERLKKEDVMRRQKLRQEKKYAEALKYEIPEPEDLTEDKT